MKSNYAVPALLITEAALAVVASLLKGRLAGDAPSAAVTAALLQVVVCLIPAIVFCALMRLTPSRLHLRVFGARHMWLLFWASVLLFAVTAGLSGVLHHFFPEAYSASSLAADPLYKPDGTLFGTVLLLLAFALVPAITEEFLLRGAVLGAYGTAGAAAAILFSSLDGALLHFSFVRFPLYLAEGLLLSVVTLATRSVFASVTVRFLSRGGFLLAEEYILRLADATEVNGLGLLLLLAGMISLLAGFFVAFEGQRIYRERSAVPRQSGDPAGPGLRGVVPGLLAPPMLLFLVLFIVLSAIGGIV